MTDPPDAGAHTVRFLLDGRVVALDRPDPTLTVLDYLRESAGRRGTKEGCAEGDCGACTVVIGELGAGGGRIVYRAVNACIRFLATLDGRELITVESLRDPSGALHPVQQSLVDHHGSQCGFCTPGFVMSLFALYLNQASATREEVLDALSGNLCRCTGYRPIIDAGMRQWDHPAPARWSRDYAQSPARLSALRTIARDPDAASSLRYPGFHAPRTLDETVAALEAQPASLVLAGGTDVGLWVTKHLRELPPMIHLGAVDELRGIEARAAELWIGAGVTVTDAWPALLERFPEFAEQAARFASPPIRNSATLCGNLANGSPIGDSIPALIALDAQLELRRGARLRRLPLERFYLGYQKKDLAPGELVAGVAVPDRGAGQVFASYKLAKRIDQDISAVSAGFRITLDAGRLTAARLVFGGMAGVAARAPRAEAALLDAGWSGAGIERAAAALAADFAPLSDLRASRNYRLRAAGNLLRRFHLELQGGRALRTAERCEPRRWTNVAVGGSAPHDSATLHVSGLAQYCDDIGLPANTLHAAFGVSPHAHARIKSLDLSAVAAHPGVVAVAMAPDVPGENNYGSAVHDDPIFAEEEVQYAGQPLFAVAAHSMRTARKAASLLRIEVEPLPALLDIRAALAAGSFVLPSPHMRRGDPEGSLQAAPRRLSSSVVIGGQDHFYLEGHIAVGDSAGGRGHAGPQLHATPERGPADRAHALGMTANQVVVQCRRMGGGFGGKESQAGADRRRRGGSRTQDRASGEAAAGPRRGHAHDRQAPRFHRGLRGRVRRGWPPAGADGDAGLALRLLGRPVRPGERPRDVSPRQRLFSGERRDRLASLQDAHRVEHRLSRLRRPAGHAWSSRRFSTTWPGPSEKTRSTCVAPISTARGAQCDAITASVSRTMCCRSSSTSSNAAAITPAPGRNRPLERRQRRDQTRPRADAGEVRHFIHRHAVQSGRRPPPGVHRRHRAPESWRHRDGTGAAHQGEPGGGGGTRPASVGDPHHGTDTSKVPNTSATAASSGPDLNGKAAQAAAATIRARLVEFLAAAHSVDPDQIAFADGEVRVGDRRHTFVSVVRAAYEARISLSATGYYRTPKIHWDKKTQSGRPFYYFAYGAAVSEVAVDTLSGETRLLRVDILHDVGDSLNPAIDRGQIEGGFLQGVGWLTSEELYWDNAGRLRTHAPSTYKIPTARDWPADARVSILKGAPNTEDSIHRSKAVGEPPLMLALSVWHAIRDACAACGPPGCLPGLQAPATPETVLRAIDALNAGRAA